MFFLVAAPFTFLAILPQGQRRQWHPTPVLLPGKSHGWRSLEGCNPWGGWGSDTTERLHFHFSLSCSGEGNGSPLQCSRLESPRDRGAWWAAVYGVTQSRTRLKRLSSSNLLLLFHLKLLPSMFIQLQPTGRLWCFSQIHQAPSSLRIYMLIVLSVWTPPSYPQPLSHLALSYHSNFYSKVITLSTTCLTINL